MVFDTYQKMRAWVISWAGPSLKIKGEKWIEISIDSCLILWLGTSIKNLLLPLFCIMLWRRYCFLVVLCYHFFMTSALIYPIGIAYRNIMNKTLRAIYFYITLWNLALASLIYYLLVLGPEFQNNIIRVVEEWKQSFIGEKSKYIQRYRVTKVIKGKLFGFWVVKQCQPMVLVALVLDMSRTRPGLVPTFLYDLSTDIPNWHSL